MECRVDKFTFFVSYFDAYECLENDSEKLAFIDALLKYAFLGVLPDFEDKLAGMFSLLKPNVDKSIKNIKQGEINGSKGGAPPGNQNAKKKTTQGLNENKTDKDREKDKDMENEQDKGNGERGNTISDGREEPPTGVNINFEKILAHG